MAAHLGVLGVSLSLMLVLIMNIYAGDFYKICTVEFWTYEMGD